MRMVESETRSKLTSSVPSTKRTLRWIGHSRSFKVILIGAGRNQSRTVCCRYVQLMPTLFLQLTKIWQREYGKFVVFNDPTQVWRRPSKKRFRIFINQLFLDHQLFWDLPFLVLIMKDNFSNFSLIRVIIISCVTLQCCFITTGAAGLVGKPGATGATGQSNITRHATTTQPPCFGARGKIRLPATTVMKLFPELLRFAC